MLVRHLNVGEFLGHGAFRNVFEYGPNLVIKIARTDCEYKGFDARHENIVEYLNWQRIKDTEWASWFAPVYTVAPNGDWLVQHRITQTAYEAGLSHDNFPSQIHAAARAIGVGDLHDGNVGYDRQGQLRIFDYQFDTKRFMTWGT